MKCSFYIFIYLYFYIIKNIFLAIFQIWFQINETVKVSKLLNAVQNERLAIAYYLYVKDDR